MLMNMHGYWVNTDKPGGRVFFVAQPTVTTTAGYTSAQGRAGSGKGASNSNHGLDPTQPLSTIAYALSLCTSGRGDTVVLLPGTVIITAVITVDEDDVCIMGYESVARGAKPGAVIQSAADASMPWPTTTARSSIPTEINTSIPAPLASREASILAALGEWTTSFDRAHS